MNIYTDIIGNINLDKDWKNKIEKTEVESIILDQWTAQKSRFVVKSDKGIEYAIALKRNSQVLDGDIIVYDAENKKSVVIKLELNPVLHIDMSKLASMDPQSIIRISVELGHALGNQHWPAVVKGTSVYVPLTVDKKVMLSVMETHHIEGISFDFQTGMDIIPYLAPHEIRRLFGGASQESHTHEHFSSNHSHGHGHGHGHGHNQDHKHAH